jgi:single-stranded-DNA-specific exonuclease
VSLAMDGAGLATHSERAFLNVTRSVTGRRWVDRLDRASHNQALAISQRHDLPDLLARVLAGRGIGGDAVAAYLDPSLRELMPDPSALVDTDAAAARLAAAIRAGEQVAILGDYDVDGATSSALLARFLRWHGIEPRIHIPDRLVEGYGPNPEAVEALAADGARLLITVDCGSSSHEALAHAASLGVEALVVDHHQVEDTLPPALAVVNPNRADDLSGQGHLAAVGVAFLLVVATARALRRAGWYGPNRPEPDLMAWLDLVALGTVADVVPLIGLNRAYVRKGLQVMRRRQAVGLAALADAARVNGPVDCYHLGFMLGPRINAGGRIGDAALGVQLLLCDDLREAGALAAKLDSLNRERQEIEARAVEEALATVEARGEGEATSVLVAHSEADWHPGIVGLVAARLKERYQRPAFAVAFGRDGLGSGSGRSIAGVDLGAAVRAAVREGILRKGGGHAMAAGLTVDRARLDELKAFLESRLATDVAASTVSHLTIDGALTASGAQVDLVKSLEAAGPYGAGNPEPVVALPAHRLGFVKATEQGHIRCAFSAADGGRVKAIAFRARDTALGEALLGGRDDALHAVGVLRIDRWNGREEVCLHLRDVALPAPVR